MNIQEVYNLMATINEKYNLILTNAKSIPELQEQLELIDTSYLHVSNNGTSEKLQIKKIIDAILNNSFGQLLFVGEITLLGNDLTVPSGVQWRILNINYFTAVAFEQTIPFTTTGNIRKDIIVANTSNELIYLAGFENIGVAIRPNIPLNTVLVTEINVTDSEFGIVVSNDFVEKQEFAPTEITGTGTISISLDGISTSFVLTDDDTSEVENFTPSTVFQNQNIYLGKFISITNRSTTDKTLKHAVSDWDMQFPDEEDLVLQPNYRANFVIETFDTVTFIYFHSINKISGGEGLDVEIFKQNVIYSTTLADLGLATFEDLTPLIVSDWRNSLGIVDEDNKLYYFEITDETFNFDVTANWVTGDASYPVTDQASFELFLSSRSYSIDNDLTSIVITNFSLISGRLKCNLTANGTSLDLSEMVVYEFLGCGNIVGLQQLNLGVNQIVTFNPTIALPNSLQFLVLTDNQIVTFNPTIALPSSLQYLDLRVNQIITFNPTIALPSSLLYLLLYNNQIVTFNPTIALPNSLQQLDLGVNQIVTFNPTIALPNSLQQLNLGVNQIVTFNPTIALPNSLQFLVLTDNQIVTFNPTIALPSSLQYLDLRVNQMTTTGYTTSETWANNQPSFTSICYVLFGSNINSVSGTNLETILISKNCNVNV
jgi:Leucine-rich repeat (LRR) protein